MQGIAAAQASNHDHRSAAAFGSGARGLVVEDHPINWEVVRGWLAKLGFRADVAANGLEALESLLRVPHVAVLIDCRMPEMDGYQATADIRRREASEPGGRRLPVIAMTAKAMRGNRERGVAAGMDDYVPKPLRIEDLGALHRALMVDQETAPAIEGHVDAAPPKRLNLRCCNACSR